MGTVTGPLDDETRKMLEAMADAYRNHLKRRVKARRPAMTAHDWQVADDGRVLLASQAIDLHLVDRLGYVHDAIAEAEHLAGVSARRWCCITDPAIPPTRSTPSRQTPLP